MTHRNTNNGSLTLCQLAALVLEMAESGNTTSGLPPGASEHTVRAALHWNDAAWPWQAYGPVVMAAVAAAVPVYGGNLPRPRMSAVMQDATLDTRLPLDAWQRQRQAMQEGHCHLLPETQITPMARIQLARDASMAQTVLQAHQPGRTVLLIAGSAHVLRSQGVPAWLPPDWSVKIAIAHTGPAATAMSKEANHLHSTPTLPTRDHCAELKAHITAGH